MSSKKINFIFLVIVVFAVGAAVWSYTQKSSAQKEKINIVSQSKASLRKLELEIPSMFCAGCVASVENYLSAVAGVTSVTARLTPTHSATVFYNPSIVSQKELLSNEVFDIYTKPSVVSDTPDSSKK
jgi:copper chaperone CopZ